MDETRPDPDQGLAALASCQGFTVLAASMAGMPPDAVRTPEGLDAALRAVDATLTMRADAFGTLDFDWFEEGCGPTHVERVRVGDVAVVAARRRRGLKYGSVRPEYRPTDDGWRPPRPPALPAPARLVGLLAPRLSRTHVLKGDGEGPLAVLVEGIGGRLISLLERRGGRPFVETRFRAREVDVAALDAPAALRLWADGGGPAHHTSRERAESARLTGLVREVGLLFPDEDPRPLADLYATVLARLDEVALRRFARLASDAGDAAMDAAGFLLASSERQDPWTTLLLGRDYLARRDNPRWFVQAFESSPAVAALVALGASLDVPEGVSPSMRTFHEAARAASDMVDAGRPPLDALAEALRLAHGRDHSPSAVRSLSRCGRYAPSLLSGPLAEAVHAVTVSVPGHRVLDHAESAALATMARRTRADPTSVSAFLRHDPSGFAAMARASMGPDGRYVESPPGTGDMFAWLVDRTRRAGARGARSAHSAASSLLFPKGRGRRALIDVVRSWHREVAGLDAEYHSVRFEARAGALAAIDLSPLFPRLLGYPARDGLNVEQILDKGRCVREGQEMDHCVATYRDRAAAGEVLLFSLVDDDGRSTVSLDVSRAAWPRLTFGQARSRSNEGAPVSHETWARSVCRWSLDHAPASFWSDVRAARACAEAVLAVEGALPDPLAERIADAAFASFRPFLGRLDRSDDRRAWVLRTGDPA